MHLRISALLAGVVLIGTVFAGAAVCETRNRALERVIAKGMFSADEGVRIQRAFAAALQAGVEDRDALALAEACVEGEFDAGQTLRVLSVAAQLALERLPVEGFLSKVEEGVSKRIPSDRIVLAAERRGLMLNKAKVIINALILQGFSVDDRDELLPDVAAALEAGRTPDQVQAILSEALREGEPSAGIRRKLFP